jgi:hypothetical protein
MSGQQQRALLMMFRPRFEQRFPASAQDETDREMLAILKKADRRRSIAAQDRQNKSR